MDNPYDDTTGDIIADFCFKKCKYNSCKWASTGEDKPCLNLVNYLKKNKHIFREVQNE